MPDSVYMVKQPGGHLRPANQSDVDALQRVKNGVLVAVDIKQPRNYEFHKKFFALLNFAFEYWNPPAKEYKGLPATKTFSRFRAEVIVRAGHYTVTMDLRGNTKLEPKSISFASMSEMEFQEVYKSVFSVLWDLVLSHVQGMTEEDVENAVRKMLEYD